METYSEIREKVKNIVVDTLRGPIFGSDEILKSSPRDFYLTGIIYPQVTTEVSFNIQSSEDKDEDVFKSDSITPFSPKAGKNLKFAEKDSEEENDELIMSTDFKPSAFGISVITEKNTLFNLKTSAAQYKESINPEKEAELNEKIDKGLIDKKYIPSEFKQYKRIPIEEIFYKVDVQEDKIILFDTNNNVLGEGRSFIKELISENLALQITRRDLGKKIDSKNIITITLVNTLKAKDKGELYDPSKSFYQPNLKAYSNQPTFCSFDDYTDLSKVDDNEELNLKLLYKDYQIFGTGHGASVTWGDEENYKTKYVESCVLPLYEVKDNDFEPNELIKRDSDGNLLRDCEILYMKRLSGEKFHSTDEAPVKNKQLISELRSFSSTYGAWINKQKNKINSEIDPLNISETDKDILKERAKKNLKVCRGLDSRINKGISILEGDKLALLAFQDANRAMFMQRVMGNFIKGRKDEFGDLIYSSDNTDEPLPDFKEDYSFKPPNNEMLAKWRPFQLAFLLSQIEGIVDPNSEDRDTTDLIWFTTGGGKTEAYLGLIAFTIFYRRLREKERSGNPNNGSGVTAIMRYTLRLLNKQQFNRAAPLICSCELIRRENTEQYGSEEISLGIWVGLSLTPNRWEDLVDCLNELRLNPDKKVKYSLPLFECPCCGTRMKPKERNGEWGITGKPGRGRKFKSPLFLYCPNTKCHFNISKEEKRDLDIVKEKCFPIYFVDEIIYEKRPTLLFATADKFASINWRNECFKLFNYNFSAKGLIKKFPAPELIVQDELHLINSSLGTIYGIYEMALDKFCSQDGIRPKIISATATARNAEKQCKLLYGREHFLQFPPPGLTIDDSFFSRKITSEDNMGRYYLGLQPSGFTNTVAQIRLIGTLLQLIPSLPYDNEYLDKYYTVLVYFNTLRELGKFRTLNEDDIVAYRNFLAKQFQSINTGYKEERTNELSSALDSDQINTALEELENAVLPKSTNHPKLKEFHKLGIRRYNDIKVLKQSGEWIKAEYIRGSYNIMGEFKSKINREEIFDKLGIEFNPADTLDAVEENEKVFDKMAKEVLPNNSRDIIHVSSATSMISVGVDIPRLNIMQVTGQPRTHSEYIQASSRVGRSQPGLVITTYNPAKNRDRSHYEGFTNYHQAFYKDVEPTTVTPFSLPALEKALPAVIFSLMQAFNNGGKVEGASWDNDTETYFEETRNYLIKRVTKTINSISDYGDEELIEVIKNVNDVCDNVKNYWQVLSNRNPNVRFSEYNDYPYYSSKDYDEQKVKQAVYVKSEYSQDFPGKPGCMTSIRNVESGSEIKIYSK